MNWSIWSTFRIFKKILTKACRTAEPPFVEFSTKSTQIIFETFPKPSSQICCYPLIAQTDGTFRLLPFQHQRTCNGDIVPTDSQTVSELQSALATTSTDPYRSCAALKTTIWSYLVNLALFVKLGLLWVS